MFKILVIDDDALNNKKIIDFVKDKPHFELTLVESGEKATDLIAPELNKDKKKSEPKKTDDKTAAVAAPAPAAPYLPQLIFLENSKILGPPKEWHEKFREALKTAGKENVPIILLSHSSDPLLIRNYLASGVEDAFVKPVMTSILESTLNYYLSGGKEIPRQMTPVKGTVEMFYPAVAKEISEFEMKIVTAKNVELNDFKHLVGDFFKWSSNRRAIGRCTDCKKDEENKTAFVETFTFVGVPAEITKEIRVWLRNAYVAQKQKE